ncbi:MAG TPA: SET domain-containing protein, partial [Vineibacter sp.]|nr:SET domain-containing protein [Vineibacter sp.]
MIHPATELRYIGPEIGYGVVALEPIPRGTVLWVLCQLDLVLNAQQMAAFGAQYQPILDRYAYIDSAGRHILCWDAGRYINHSCDPAMLGVGGEVEIAVRDIAQGEELTCEYATLNIAAPMPCRCGSPHCRGTIDSDDLTRLW